MKYAELSSIQKAAIALVAFGPVVSASVLRGMRDSDLETLTIEIANLRDVPPDIEEAVLKDCHDIFMARQYVSQGGVDFAMEVLEKAVGPVRAKEIISRVEATIKQTGFTLIQNIDPKQLASYIQQEHPQTIALILTQLPPGQSASVMGEMSPEIQSEVAYRIATMEKITPDILQNIEKTLESHFATGLSRALDVSGGAKKIAEILNFLETSSEKNILQSIEAEDADLSAEIKNMMFVFDDLVLLDDRSIQRVLKEVETKDLSIALKAATDEVKEKIYSNVSERVGHLIKEEMEFMGPMRLSDVEAAQQRMVEVVRRLEEEGQLVISGRGGGKEDVIV
ncbi:MAG: flagellar motor switch protein FliG [candidate division Zixibacteria bacterium]|nr:flagellar motor switch protein FliG [candidate division Zixibacteria bacterium]